MRNCIESLREFLVGAKGSSLWGAFLYSDLLPLAIIAGSFWTGKPGSTLTPERGVNNNINNYFTEHKSLYG